MLDRTAASSGVRPGLARLLDHINPGDALIVWRLDRSIADLVRVVTTSVQGEWGFISLTEEIDTTPPVGRPQLRIFAMLDAFQHDLIRERTAVGLTAARASGHKGGRPRVMTAEKIEAAHQMLAQGRPKKVIARGSVSTDPPCTDTFRP